MKLILLVIMTFGVIMESKAQKVITLLPNGETKSYTNGELKGHMDRWTDGNKIVLSDSGQVIAEYNMKGGYINGYRKLYKNGILVELGLFEHSDRIGTHYFWDDKGILKKSITYKNGKAVASKDY